MIRGVCPHCGQLYYWSVQFPAETQSCDDCGCGLQISRDMEKNTNGPSPFSTEFFTVQALNQTDSKLQRLV